MRSTAALSCRGRGGRLLTIRFPYFPLAVCLLNQLEPLNCPKIGSITALLNNQLPLTFPLASSWLPMTGSSTALLKNQPLLTCLAASSWLPITGSRTALLNNQLPLTCPAASSWLPMTGSRTALLNRVTPSASCSTVISPASYAVHWGMAVK